MPFYYTLKKGTETGRRTADRLLEIRDRLEDPETGVPPRTMNETLLIATWNIREFDSSSYGRRLDESYYYIAEIISHFDIVALQEVRRDLKALKKLRRILGYHWDFIVSDVTVGTRGNKERLAFLFDSRKVRFSGLAGEIVIPPISENVEEGRVYHPRQQLARTPFFCGFQAGWFKFNLCTVHLLYGDNVEEHPDRVREIELLSSLLAKRAKAEQKDGRTLVLLGDFNIFSRDNKTMRAMTDKGFYIPEALQDVPATNVAIKKKAYDQIAFMPYKKDVQPTGRAGVFDFFNAVFRKTVKSVKEDEPIYVDLMPRGGKDPVTKKLGGGYYRCKKNKAKNAAAKSRYYNTWRTYQMSDHLPMWIELRVDFSHDYLERRKNLPVDPAGGASG